MKILGHSETGFIASLSREEMCALYVQSYEDRGYVPLGTEVDILSRLRPTVRFEENATSGPHMVARLREMADELEKGLAQLRAATAAPSLRAVGE